MTLNGSLLRSLRSDPDLGLLAEDGVRIDSDISFADELAVLDENHERQNDTWRAVGQARNVAIGADLGGWTPQGIESVRARMDEWEFSCWIGEINRDPTARRIEMDRLIASGTEADIAAFRERCAIADQAASKAGIRR